MIKKLQIIVILSFLLVIGAVYAEEFKVTLKNGREMTWSNYIEKGNQYCTNKYGGTSCINKNTVASIQSEDEYPEGAIVIHRSELTEDAKKEAEELYNEQLKELEEYNREEEAKDKFSHSVAVGDEWEIKKCKKKVDKLLKKAEKAKYRSQSKRFLEAARIQSDLCYGRSSPKKEQSVTGPLNQISRFNYVDADGNVWHCPSVMGRRTININRDCTPQ